MTARVVVFIDWENVYRSARRMFHADHDPFMDGQVDPVLLGMHLASRQPDRVLKQVRIYRGLPDSTKQPAAYGANQRQAAVWDASPLTEVIRRPLQYPRGWPNASLPGEKPREKGIDVALAIDFVRLAIDDSYDVGVLVSGDTDLKPALEAVYDYKGGAGPRPETAAWSVQGVHSTRLSISPRRLWCHWMERKDYQTMIDTVDYTL